MSLKLDKPMVFLDLEATGVDVQRDRIVQIACIRLRPDGTRDSFESLVDPQMPIPPETTVVHGITDSMVRGQPAFRDLAPKLLEYFAGCDFGGFGIVRFDIPMLSAEFKRAATVFDASAYRSIDAMLIFHRMEPRSLSAALKFYTGKSLENAHNAKADAEASLEVLLAQVQRYGDATSVGGPGSKQTLPLPADVQGLHEWCTAPDPRFVDAKGKFVWRHGTATFAFGKYQTRALEDVVRIDRAYLEWLMRAESTPPDVIEICRKALVGFFPQQQKAGVPAGGK